jgi:hypothetical protein
LNQIISKDGSQNSHMKVNIIIIIIILILFEWVTITLKEPKQKGIVIEKKPDLYILQRKHEIYLFFPFRFSILISNNL